MKNKKRSRTRWAKSAAQKKTGGLVVITAEAHGGLASDGRRGGTPLGGQEGKVRETATTEGKIPGVDREVDLPLYQNHNTTGGGVPYGDRRGR